MKVRARQHVKRGQPYLILYKLGSSITIRFPLVVLDIQIIILDQLQPPPLPQIEL